MSNNEVVKKRKINLKHAFSELFDKLKESFLSVLPIALIVCALFGIQYIFINLNYIEDVIIDTSLFLVFIVCSIILAIGLGIFSVGVDMSSSEVGQYIGEDLTKRNSLILIIIIGFLFGLLMTIAEPDLTVLANYTKDEINPWIFKIAVGIGVGVFLVIAIIRILFSKSIKMIVFLFYGILFMVASLYGDGESAFLEIAFDSGGVTTGPVTVPFLMAFGIGIAGARGGHSAKDDSFGVSGICSVGPILVVLIIGLILKPEATSASIDEYTIGEAILHSLSDVAIAILPVVCFFVLYDLLFLKLHKNELIRILFGFFYAYIGLVIFLSAANYGFIRVGHAVGKGFSKFNIFVIVLSCVLGASIVLAEPAVHILNEQVENITNGVISKKSVFISLAGGVSLAILLATLRTLYFPSLNVLYILVPGYIIALVLSLFVDDLYVALAFDSGGVASGAMASCFVLPYVMGVAEGSSSSSTGFGVVGMIALMPIITVQILGVIAKVKADISYKKARERVREINDCQIIHF